MEQVRPKHPLEHHAQLVDVQTVRVGDLMRTADGYEPVTQTRFSPVTRRCIVELSFSLSLGREPDTKVRVIRRWHRPDWTGD